MTLNASLRPQSMPTHDIIDNRDETLEDHMIGFRQSAEYQEWKRLLHHFYDPFPTVEHFETVLTYPADAI